MKKRYFKNSMFHQKQDKIALLKNIDLQKIASFPFFLYPSKKIKEKCKEIYNFLNIENPSCLIKIKN